MDRTQDDDAMRELLATPRRIAVLGASPDPSRDSHRILRFLREHGHDAVPVNPMAPDVMGMVPYRSLAEAEAAGPVDIVDVFRSPHHLPSVVDEFLAGDAPWLWLQLGVVDEPSIARAAAKREVIADRCIKVEMHRLVA